MICFSDTHTHYDRPEYDPDRADLLRAVYAAGVTRVLNVSYDMESSERSVALAEEFSFLRAAVGIHPQYIDGFGDAAKARLKELTDSPFIAAAGECGLDYRERKNNKTGVVVKAEMEKRQQEVFDWQLQLCAQSGLPMVVHSVAAAQDTLELLRAYPAVRGVMHSFSYSAEIALECVKLGWYIGIGPLITRPGTRKIREVAAKIPLERMLLETDSPFQVTESVRGQRGDSRMLAEIAGEIAGIRGISVEEVAALTTENAKRLFS